MNDIYFWGILASITGIAIMISVIKHKKSVSAIKNGTYLIFSILMICLGITTILFKRYDSICAISIGITFRKRLRVYTLHNSKKAVTAD